MQIGFGDALVIVGLLLTVAAALSGVMRGTVLSISILGVTLGIVLALADVVSVDANDESIVHVITLALLLTLFADGLVVEGELSMAGSAQPVTAELTVGDGGAIRGTIPLAQSNWGIKPYRGLMGALKVRDEVEIVIEARLAQT